MSWLYCSQQDPSRHRLGTPPSLDASPIHLGSPNCAPDPPARQRVERERTNVGLLARRGALREGSVGIRSCLELRRCIRCASPEAEDGGGCRARPSRMVKQRSSAGKRRQAQPELRSKESQMQQTQPISPINARTHTRSTHDTNTHTRTLLCPPYRSFIGARIATRRSRRACRQIVTAWRCRRRSRLDRIIPSSASPSQQHHKRAD